MAQVKEFYKVPSKFAVSVGSLLISAAIAFNVWAVQSVYARPTEQRVKELINDKSDAPVIFEMLKSIREDIAELKEILRTK